MHIHYTLRKKEDASKIGVLHRYKKGCTFRASFCCCGESAHSHRLGVVGDRDLRHDLADVQYMVADTLKRCV